MLASGCLGGIVTGLLAARPIGAAAAATAADAALDIQVLQTASSLETLLIGLYSDALGTGPLGANAPSAKGLATMTNTTARDTLVRLLTDTQEQHREHRLAFQTITTALGGKDQNDPNPKYGSGVAAADVSSPLRLVDYAAVLEKILTDTYVFDLSQVENVKAKETLASVMAVEAQHLAVLRTVGALLRDGTPQFLKIPFGADLVNLPATLATIAFPDAREEISSTAEPESGAVA
ncbi:MAG: hypothetical protein QOH36_1851 [Actinomycetota bacterium]|nr:hypothetical protein [Actinomycetota bacterium]